MILSKENIKFIEDYWEDKKHRSGEDKISIWYSYSSRAGKYSRSNILDEILIKEFTPIEVYLWTAIMTTLKQSRDYMESGVVYLTHPHYKHVCSDRVFMETKRKFVEYKLLVPTLHKKIFIVNPLYTSKFYKIVEDK